jgi:beta-glucosidase
MEFPKNFLWGAASSACQTEGWPLSDGGGASVWDAFCAKPGRIFENEDCSVACDGYHRFREDVGILASLGLQAYRFSVSWARVDPQGDGNWNEAGLRYYDEVVGCCLMHGVEPFLTLHHWELPQALEARGGWRSRETAEAFARYAGMIAARFRGRVKHYLTLNEPQCVVFLGHVSGEHAPGRQLPPADVFTVWKNLMLAHGLALRAVKAADPDAAVGVASTGRICYPETSADEQAAREETFALHNGDWLFTHAMFLDPICRGSLTADPGSQLAALAETVLPAEWAAMRAAPDFIGLNIYNGTPVRSRADGGAVYVPRCPGFARTATKWPVTEQVMYWGPVFAHERYGLPLYITENGLSCNDRLYLDGQPHDADRIDFLKRYLRQLSSAAEAADVRGYFHWSLTDNFEWNRGYSERFGLVYIDYSTQRRILKDSARWFSGVAASNGAAVWE